VSASDPALAEVERWKQHFIENPPPELSPDQVRVIRVNFGEIKVRGKAA
jgi:hypothetical protein